MADTPLAEWVRVTRAAHRIEECFHRAKSEAGLADYEVRAWEGWHHHPTLALLAAWFLTLETIREKKAVPAITVPQVRHIIASLPRKHLNVDSPEQIARHATRRLTRNEEARLYHNKQRNCLAPKRIHQRR